MTQHNLSLTEPGHSGNLYLAENVYIPHNLSPWDPKFKYLYETKPACNGKEKISVPCDAVMRRMQCTMFKNVGDIKDTNGQFQLTTMNLHRVAEIDLQSKVILLANIRLKPKHIS